MASLRAVVLALHVLVGFAAVPATKPKNRVELPSKPTKVYVSVSTKSLRQVRATDSSFLFDAYVSVAWESTNLLACAPPFNPAEPPLNPEYKPDLLEWRVVCTIDEGEYYDPDSYDPNSPQCQMFTDSWERSNKQSAVNDDNCWATFSDEFALWWEMDPKAPRTPFYVNDEAYCGPCAQPDQDPQCVCWRVALLFLRGASTPPHHSPL